MGDERSTLSMLCTEVGVSFSALSVDLQERLSLLAHRLAVARAIFDHYAEQKPERAFDALEQSVVLIGSLFADIGKTGPPEATAEGQQLIVEMFSVEGVLDDSQSVSRFLDTHFPSDARRRRELFSSLGLDVEMSLRSFWNLHTGWTFELTRDSGLPEEAVAAAATHHLLEDINPEDIVAEDGRFLVAFGGNVAFDRAEKLVILLDKYDALLRRGRRGHEAAIAWLQNLIARHPRFGNDEELSELLHDLDVVGRQAAPR